jgi:hypothetical protein
MTATGAGAENALKLERGEVHVEGVIRQTIRKASLMLSEDINDLVLSLKSTSTWGHYPDLSGHL